MNVKERALVVWKRREDTLIHLTSFLRILLIFFWETFLGLNKAHFMVGWLAQSGSEIERGLVCECVECVCLCAFVHVCVRKPGCVRLCEDGVPSVNGGRGGGRTVCMRKCQAMYPL